MTLGPYHIVFSMHRFCWDMSSLKKKIENASVLLEYVIIWSTPGFSKISAFPFIALTFSFLYG